MKSRALKPPKPQFQILFEERTQSIYSGMKGRKPIIAAGGVPFTLREFREWMLARLGGKYEGVARCEYCTRWLDISTVQAEHMIPVARPWGGSPGLDNLTLADEQCNCAKGRMSAEGFKALIEFMLQVGFHPYDRQDVLNRLAAGNEGQQMMWARQRQQREAAQRTLIR